MTKILSERDITSCENDLRKAKKNTTEYFEALNKVVSLYENNQTVRTLFESGTFGESQYRDLQELKRIMGNYLREFNESLIPETEKYFAYQKELLNNPTAGGED